VTVSLQEIQTHSQTVMHDLYSLKSLVCTRVRPIPVSGIGYRPILASIGGYRYRPILIWVSALIPVVLSFVYLSQQSTLLQHTPIVSSLYRIFGIFRAYTPHTYKTCTHLYPAQNRIFSTKNLYSPVSVSESV